MIIPSGTRQIVQLDSFYVTDSPFSATNIAVLAMFWPVLMIIPSWTREIVQLDSFYVADSPLSVTRIAELATFLKKSPVLMIIP